MKAIHKENNYQTKINKTGKFFLDLAIFAEFKSLEETFYIDFLNLMTGFSNDQVFTEFDSKKTEHFGKIEQIMMTIIANNEFSRLSNKNFNLYFQQTQILYLKNHMRPFTEYVEKNLLKKTDLLIQTTQKFHLYLDKMINQAIDKPEVLMTHDKFYAMLFKYSLFSRDFLSKKAKALFELASNFIEIMLNLTESQNLELNDDFFSLEKLITSLFECLAFEENGFNRLFFCENLINLKIIEKFENLVLEKRSTFALMCLKHFFDFYQKVSPTMKEYFHVRTSKENFEKILRLNETVILKMNNIKYDLGSIIRIALKDEKYSKEKYMERLKNIYLTRYFLFKTNKGTDFYFEDILRHFQPKELFQTSSKFEENAMQLFPPKKEFQPLEKEIKNHVFEAPKLFAPDPFNKNNVSEMPKLFAASPFENNVYETPKLFTANPFIFDIQPKELFQKSPELKNDVKLFPSKEVIQPLEKEIKNTFFKTPKSIFAEDSYKIQKEPPTIDPKTKFKEIVIQKDRFVLKIQPKELFQAPKLEEKSMKLLNNAPAKIFFLDTFVHKIQSKERFQTTSQKFEANAVKWFPPKDEFQLIDTERKTPFFVPEAFSNEKIQEYSSMKSEFFPPNEIFQTFERKLELNESNLLIYLENSKKLILASLIQKKYRKASALNTFFQNINLLLLTSNLHFFTSMKNDYSLNSYPERFANCIIRTSLILYNPLSFNMAKGDVLSLSCINLAIQNPILGNSNPEKSQLLFVHIVDLALKKIVNDVILKFNDQEDQRLLIQFYDKGFLGMDSDLITEENYDKCVVMKQFEFLLNLIKKFNRIQNKFSKNSRLESQIQNNLTSLLQKISQIYRFLIVLYFRSLTEKTWKIEECSLFFDFISSRNGWRPSKCLTSFRYLKSMLLLLKSFRNFNFRENMNITEEEDFKTFDLKAFNRHMINNLMGGLCYSASQCLKIRTRLIEEEFLAYFMRLEGEIYEPLLDELQYLESFFKLLEVLCFDKEFYHFNICKRIMEMFYDKSQGKFRKKILMIEFESVFQTIYEKNKAAFIEAFSKICEVKKNKRNKFVIKLKKGLFL